MAGCCVQGYEHVSSEMASLETVIVSGKIHCRGISLLGVDKSANIGRNVCSFVCLYNWIIVTKCRQLLSHDSRQSTDIFLEVKCKVHVRKWRYTSTHS